MKKAGADPKVKKTLVRNHDIKVPKQAFKSSHDIAGTSKSLYGNILQSKNENLLNQPTLCSSEVLANYLSKVKKDAPQISCAELEVNNAHISSDMTKKLNFHINDRIYRNLVELNADAANLKSKKEKRATKSVGLIKKDVEPNIEDFCYNEKEDDLMPNIPTVVPKIKRARPFESGELHRLTASFEKL